MWGSLYLGICFVIEIILLVWCTLSIAHLGARFRHWTRGLRTAGIITLSLAFIVLAHTLQVWLWAGVWIWYDVLSDWNEALYFSLVTYTTVGYGDVVLGSGLRIFAAFAAVAGLLAFGLSTAYLVAIMTRLFEGRMPR
ncbi:Ion channel [Ruegeria marina]|uniref:Ion channel n=2 Tax=Ruegeria marina TaxID=639004 RepID=A0A1G6JXP4_9RHOB|nr:Ion channel [Ruegeria marina]